jgi:hypothetical protein
MAFGKRNRPISGGRNFPCSRPRSALAAPAVLVLHTVRVPNGLSAPPYKHLGGHARERIALSGIGGGRPWRWRLRPNRADAGDGCGSRDADQKMPHSSTLGLTLSRQSTTDHAHEKSPARRRQGFQRLTSYRANGAPDSEALARRRAVAHCPRSQAWHSRGRPLKAARRIHSSNLTGDVKLAGEERP